MKVVASFRQPAPRSSRSVLRWPLRPRSRTKGLHQERRHPAVRPCAGHHRAGRWRRPGLEGIPAWRAFDAAQDLRVEVRLLQAGQPRRRHGRDPARAGARRRRQPAERIERRRRPDQDRGLAAGGGHRRPEPELRRQRRRRDRRRPARQQVRRPRRVAGGINTKKVEAQTVLSLVNTRTSEEEYNIEGFAKKSDMSFGLGGAGGGFSGWGAAGGGAYASTDVGKVVGLGLPRCLSPAGDPDGRHASRRGRAAPRQSFIATAAFELKRSPSKSSGTVRKIESGMMLVSARRQGRHVVGSRGRERQRRLGAEHQAGADGIEH